MTVYGDLTVVASHDIGSLGPAEGKPVVYHWPLYRNLVVLLPYVFLCLLFVAKPNRNRYALAVLVPFGILVASTLVLASALGDPGVEEPLLPVVAGLAALWLVSHCLAGKRRIGQLGRVVLVYAGYVFLTGFSMSLDIAAPVMLSLAIIPILSGFALAGRRCRGSFKATRFVLWAFLGVFLAFAVVAAPVALVAAGSEPDALVAIPLIMTGMASALCILLLPFFVLTFRSGFYRQRFLAVFGLTEGTPVPEAGPPPCDVGNVALPDEGMPVAETGPPPEPSEGGNHDEVQ